MLRVGTLTSIGRALFPAVLRQYTKHQPGWQVELRSFGWGDPTAGLGGQETDASFVWLPTCFAEIETEVLATEPRLVAVSSRHHLAGRTRADFADIAGEPFAALPASAGPTRDFWLAVGNRAGQPPRIAAEVSSADEVFELVSAGTAVTLLAEGNAAVYARPGITCIPVDGLEPARLAIAWRRGDRRACVADFVRACREAAADPGRDERS